MAFEYRCRVTKRPSRCLGALVAAGLLASCGGSGGNAALPLNCSPGTHEVGNACVPNTLTQAQVDGATVWALLNSIVDFYNQNLAGRPVGSQNVTADCPGGGTVTITGSSGYSSSNAITTSNLTYAMSGCQTSQISADGNTVAAIATTGTVTETGSWNIPDYKSGKYQSTGSLIMTGTVNVTGFAPATINQSCNVGLTHNISGSTNTLTGTICDRPASST
jgi:hypothetical protein